MSEVRRRDVQLLEIAGSRSECSSHGKIRCYPTYNVYKGSKNRTRSISFNWSVEEVEPCISKGCCHSWNVATQIVSRSYCKVPAWRFARVGPALWSSAE